MEKVNVKALWPWKFDCSLPKKVDLYVDNFIDCQTETDAIKILLLFEPEEISGSQRHAIDNQKHFDYILTHNEEILKTCPNARLCEFGSSWISDDYSYPKKSFSTSIVVGFKNYAPGHKMRHKVWMRQEEIKTPKNFYLSKHNNNTLPAMGVTKVLGEKKDPLFDSQFHIVIENAKRNYWFTEKLMDAIKTKTVPIYWGCPNISKYFNTKGMIIVNSDQEIINACNSLTDKTYNEMIPFIEENYEKGKAFYKLDDIVSNKLREVLNEG